MQRPDEKKRRLIATAAARLFATRPFHKVKLDDVAAAARVGKGTLYIYFSSKEELYFSLIYDGFAQLVDQLTTSLEDGDLRPREALRRIVADLTRFAFAHPHLFELVRTAGSVMTQGKFPAKRRELTDLIERVLRRGNRGGEFDDPHPELTALMIPGYVRSVMVFGPRDLNEAIVARHIVTLIERGVSVRAGELRRTNGRRLATAGGRR